MCSRLLTAHLVGDGRLPLALDGGRHFVLFLFCDCNEYAAKASD